MSDSDSAKAFDVLNNSSDRDVLQRAGLSEHITNGTPYSRNTFKGRSSVRDTTPRISLLVGQISSAQSRSARAERRDKSLAAAIPCPILEAQRVLTAYSTLLEGPHSPT